VVVDPFRPPPCPWCSGNRGIEYATALGSPVRAVATGVVTFSGVVAGVRYVVVDVGAGRRVTYGRLDASPLRGGDRVLVGGRIGSTGRGLFFGLRVHGEYRDPAPLLGVLVGRPRLVPTDGSAARPAPPPRLRCAATVRRRARR
jgi:murein DD-endopeptidase MepM/ murein hydrolase activator NlpD